jgi:hypothetical protein
MSASAIWRKTRTPGHQKGYGIGKTVDTLVRHEHTSNDFYVDRAVIAIALRHGFGRIA